MNQFVTVILFLFFQSILFGQVLESNTEKIKQSVVQDSTKKIVKDTKKNKKEVALIEDYLVMDSNYNLTQIDTSLNITKEYKYNYLRKDNFYLMEFANMGQTYNTLVYDFSENNSIPLFGARARHFSYFEEEDIRYYKVPTPTTELFYKTGMLQGQVLDALFTVNTSNRFNFSIAYKGLRSNGNYQRHLTSNGNFRFTSNYSSKNERYIALAHVVMQDLTSEESGGIRDEDIENFTSGDEDFKNRDVFSPNLNDAENKLDGKRFFLKHSYQLLKEKDSTINAITLHNILKFEDKSFRFTQATPTIDFFGSSFSSSINDEVKLEHFQASFSAAYTNSIIGNLKFGFQYDNYNYGYNRVTVLENQIITNRLKGSVVGILASYTKKFKNITLSGNGNLNVTGDFDGYNFNSNLDYNLNTDINILGYFNVNSTLPNYNTLLQQSSYVNYNWDNTNQFSNVERQQIGISLGSLKYGTAAVEFNNINNYTYFTNVSESTTQPKSIKPVQSNEAINHLKIELSKEINFRKFTLDNRLLYQNSENGKGVLNIPDFVLRSTIYYSNQFFKKSLFLQTGVTFNYFSEYNMNAYDPLLAEFYVQNETSLGGFPRMDFFVNARVRQTRIYLKAEHFNASFTGYDFFSAPNYPFRDFIVRFGLVWNFFL